MILRWPHLLTHAIYVFVAYADIPSETATKSGAAQPSSKGTAHFTDISSGRISWTLDDISLPWRGSYEFLEPTTATATSIALLSVADNSTGVKLAECRHSVAGKDVKRTLSRWKRVTWLLSVDSLKCNISKDLNATDVISIPIASQADGGSLRREFLVRISAGKGPRCVKDLSAGREQMPVTCPPRFLNDGFSAQNFECGCPELKSTIRRKPISMPKTSGQAAENALNGGDITSAAASSETLLDVPAQSGNVPFPIFQLTSSMEHGGKRGADGVVAALQADASPSSQPSAVTGTGRPTETTTPEPVDGKNDSAAPTNACTNFDCQHNGTCVLGANTQPTCLCSEGYSGAHCEVDLCSQIVCQNGGSCLIRNGRAVCSCLPGTSGDHCSEAVCTPECENGGVCSAPNGQPICTCAHPFLGANCNIFDVCSDNSTCSQYGGTAKCLIDATSLATKFSKLLVNSSYACLCRNENEEYVDCADLANTERAAVASAVNATDRSNGSASFSSLTTASLPVPPPVPETISPLRNFNINSSDALAGLSAPQGPPGTGEEQGSVESATGRTHQQSHQASVEGSHQKGPSSETSGGEVVEKPASDATRDPGRISQEGGTTVGFPTDNLNGGITSASKDDESAGEASKEVEPAFPLTNIPLENVNAANATRTEPASVEEEHPAQFTRLPDLPPRKASEESAGTTSSFSTSSSTEEGGSTTASTTLTEETVPSVGPEGIEDEMGGDNGFERVTQIVDSPSPSGATGDGRVTPPVASGGVDHSAGGSDGSAPVETPAPHRPSGETNSVEEHHGSSPHGEHGAVATEATHPPDSTDGNSVLEKPAPGSISAPTADNRTQPVHKSSALTWIVGISALVVLLMGSTFAGMFLVRYMRRSRRLHGKYNPAREEHAVASTYSMPMTSVGKEERLI